MDPLALTAAAAVAAGAVIGTAATRRVPLVATVMIVLILLPLCGRTLPATAGWSLAAGGHLAATLLGGLMLWIAFRPTGPRLSQTVWPGARGWAVVAAVGVVIGVSSWPLFIESLDPARAAVARATEVLDPLRWTFGAGLASLIAGLRQSLAPEAARLAASAALFVAGAWLIGTAGGARPGDLGLMVAGAVLPIAAAAAAWRAARVA
ncbi:MAG: hypothetical protein ABIZ34_08565 [Candidatus Limnocylindrales bacterium]